MEMIKLVVVGDGTVGKTCLLITYATGKYPEQYVPTVFDNYEMTLTIKDEQYKLGLFDTAGQEDYDHLRPLAYPDTDIFLVCFSVDSMDSFENVRQKWIIELLQHGREVPRLLVGTKSDLSPAVTEKQAQQLAKEIKAVKYMQCSAKTKQGLDDVFNEAIRAAFLGAKPGKKKKVCVLQ